MSRNISAAMLETSLTILAFANKKEIKKLVVIKLTNFHVELRSC